MADNDTLHYRSCPLCEATCGLELTVREGTVVRIRGDRDNSFSKGFICPKGSALHRLHADPDRLRMPVVRRGDDLATATWEEVTWDEAWAVVEEGLRGVIDTHGRDAVAVYLGNPSVHSLGPVIFNGPLVKALGTKNVFSASTVDQMPKHVSSGYLFGNPLLMPVPDLDRTDYLFMLGANPYESNGSLCTAPDFPGRMEAIRARGGRIVTVDPRNTKTAQNSDEWIAIRPGTDAHLLVAILHVLFAEDLVHTGQIVALTSGMSEVIEAVEPFSPEIVAPITGIDADTIRRIARELAAAPTAAVYGRIGTHTVAFGTLASWAVDVINIVTGNLDTPGGAMFPLPAHDSGRGKGKGRGFVTGRRYSRVKNYPEIRGEFPVATMADEILTPGEGQVRALVTVAGNPAVSTPHAGRLDAALSELEFMVCVDPYRNETTRHANVILPPPSALERSDYHLAFFSLAVRNFAEWSGPLFETDSPQEHSILGRLALIATGPEAGSDPAVLDAMMLDGALQAAISASDSPIADRTVDELRAIVTADPDRTTVDHLIDVMMRTGAYGDWFGAVPDGISLDALHNSPHGIDLGALTSRLPAALRTQSGTIELANPAIIADFERLLASLSGPLSDPDALVLIGRRHLRSNNSWMHNIDVLAKGKFRCTLQLHPDDANRLGLVEGGDAHVTSNVGTLIAPVEITDQITKGVVSLPHGWGHDRPGSASEIASRRPGVNSNLLTDPEMIDPLSGNAVLNGIPVEVRAVTA
jgi:anaerobic selenocysteine-containing dehydrogenase